MKKPPPRSPKADPLDVIDLDAMLSDEEKDVRAMVRRVSVSSALPDENRPRSRCSGVASMAKPRVWVRLLISRRTSSPSRS